MKKPFLFLFTMALVASLMVSCGQESASTSTAEATPEKSAKATPVAKKKETTKVLNVGDTAPDFSLKNVDGKMVSLADMKDAKGYIITFTCNHCPYSVMYEDRLIELHNTYAPKGYPVIAINPNDPEAQPKDSFDAMQERAKEKAFPFAYLFDDGQKVYPQYGATRTPHIFLLNKDRMVEYIGAIDDSAKDADAVEHKYVENAIAAIEKGEKPDPNFTKAIGCSIKKI